MRFFAFQRLTDHVIAVGCKGDDPADLLDFELLARPPQALGQRAQRGHDGAAGQPQASRAAPATALATPSTARAAALALIGSRTVDRDLYQVLGIVAIRLIELPAAAEIHAGRRPLLELFAR